MILEQPSQQAQEVSAFIIPFDTHRQASTCPALAKQGWEKQAVNDGAEHGEASPITDPGAQCSGGQTSGSESEDNF